MGKYYTTQEVAQKVGISARALHVRWKDGRFPEPDFIGKPHKWLKKKIDAMMCEEETDEA